MTDHIHGIEFNQIIFQTGQFHPERLHILAKNTFQRLTHMTEPLNAGLFLQPGTDIATTFRQLQAEPLLAEGFKQRFANRIGCPFRSFTGVMVYPATPVQPVTQFQQTGTKLGLLPEMIQLLQCLPGFGLM